MHVRKKKNKIKGSMIIGFVRLDCFIIYACKSFIYTSYFRFILYCVKSKIMLLVATKLVLHKHHGFLTCFYTMIALLLKLGTVY